MEDVDYKGHDIFLNVYDLSPSNDKYWCMGLGGVFHSGIEVAGTEYSFTSDLGGLGEKGIFLSEPKSFHSYETPLRESRKMGIFKGRLSEVRNVIDCLRNRFNAVTFHKLYNNSNTFCEIFLWDLIGVRAPLFLNRLPFIGGVLNCMFPINNIRKPILELTGAEYIKKEKRRNKIYNNDDQHEFKTLNKTSGKSLSFWRGKSDDKTSKNNKSSSVSSSDSSSISGNKRQRSSSFTTDELLDSNLVVIDNGVDNNIINISQNKSKKSDSDRDVRSGHGYRNLDATNESKLLSMDNIEVVACGCSSWICFGSQENKAQRSFSK